MLGMPLPKLRISRYISGPFFPLDSAVLMKVDVELADEVAVQEPRLSGKVLFLLSSIT